MPDLPLVDSHAHLALPEFDADRDAVLARAETAGVVAVLCVAETAAQSDRILDLCARHPLLRAALGVHPDHLLAVSPEAFLREVDEVCESVLAHRDRVTAIGEVGLDYWRVQDEGGQAVQREALRRFCALSRETGLPMTVHSRSAGRETIAALAAGHPAAAILHAFDGRAATAQAGLDAGFWFSVPPSLVHSRQKQKLFARLPLDRLLLETDSPVLGPDLGVRNEPANVRIAAEALASLKALPLDAVAQTTTANARRLLGL
jgi:TatD DNase family protein